MIPPRSAWLSALRFSGRFSVMRRTCGAGSSIRTTSELIGVLLGCERGGTLAHPVRAVAQTEIEDALEQRFGPDALVRGRASEVFAEVDVGVRVDVDQPGRSRSVDA